MGVPGPEHLATALAAHAWTEHPALPGRRNDQRAGVLVPLCWEEDDVVALLTLRPPTLRHGGEVSFPGGRPEAEDASLEATARREAREELGLTRLEVLGRLSSMPVYTSDFRLEPFVAVVDPSELRPEPGEVARVLRVGLGATLAMPALESVRGVERGAPFEMPVLRAEGLVVFGATALTLVELLSVYATVVGAEVPPLRPGPLALSDLFRWGAAAGGR